MSEMSSNRKKKQNCIEAARAIFPVQITIRKNYKEDCLVLYSTFKMSPRVLGSSLVNFKHRLGAQISASNFKFNFGTKLQKLFSRLKYTL